jgi:hypothetical protein
MGVVRIDDELEQEIAEFIKKKENRYKYPSKSAFLNIIINDYFVSQKSKSKKEVRK